MIPSILTVTEVNQNFSRARKAVANGPVIITDRGEPALVLMSYAEFCTMTARNKSLLELIDVPGTENTQLEIPPRAKGGLRPADFE